MVQQASRETSRAVDSGREKKDYPYYSSLMRLPRGSTLPGNACPAAASDRNAVAYAFLLPGKASMFSTRRIITSLFLASDSATRSASAASPTSLITGSP